MRVEINESQEWLYRYRRFSDDNINALWHNRLYFSTPQYFNDPYDNLMYANVEQIVIDIATNISMGMDGYVKDLTDKDPLIGGFAYAFWKGSKREEYFEQFLEEVIGIVKRIKEKVQSNVKILCFSEEYDSMLMWSHYANNHKGFLLVYSHEDIMNAECYEKEGVKSIRKTRLEQVSYVEEKIDLTEDVEDCARSKIPNLGDVEAPDGKIGQTKLRKMVTQKATDWSYEHEWRLIPRTIDLDEESPLHYIECIPKAIVLGSRCEIEDKEKIFEIAYEKKIPIYQMVLNEESTKYKLEVKEIYNGFSKKTRN